MLTLSPTNSVGIITTTPVVPLDVRSAQSPNLGAGTEANFYYGSSALVPSQPVPANSYTLTAYFQDRIISGSAIISLNGTVTASDARLKNIIGKSDGAKDLETLGKIEVTDYTTKLSDKIFVYGKYCPDMKAIDYEAISMLNVSATQELSKKVQILEKDKFELQSRAKLLTDVEEEQRVMISKQQQQIADQAAEIAALKSLASDVEVLKQAVTRMREQQHGGVRAVALEQ